MEARLHVFVGVSLFTPVGVQLHVQFTAVNRVKFAKVKRNT